MKLTSGEERTATDSACALGDQLGEFLYYDCYEDELSPRSRNVLEAAYRPSKGLVEHYYGDIYPLVYSGKVRGTPFTKQTH